jgi:hypothetical protein
LGKPLASVPKQRWITYRITPKLCDVLPNPVNGQSLVLYREILLLSIAKTKDIETIVERDENKRLTLRDRLSNDPSRVYAGISVGGMSSNSDVLPQIPD